MQNAQNTNNGHRTYLCILNWLKIFRRTVLLFVFITVLLGIFLLPIIRYGQKQEALAVLGEAKNVELSLRLVSLEYYGKGSTIFSSQHASGMTDEFGAEVRKMAMTDGEIILLEWSNEEMRPLVFLYTEWPYTARFEYDLEKQESSWEVYRSQKTLEFGK